MAANPIDASPPGAGSLFQVFRDGSAYTKSALASTTGLARSTVSARVAELERAGLVLQRGEAVSEGGRPAGRFAFNVDGGRVLAVDLGATHATVALTDLAAEVLSIESSVIDVAEGPEAVLTRVLRLAQRIVGANAASPLVGVGIGVPSRVDTATGSPIDPPIMPGWDRYDIPSFVRSRLGVPVLVDNDVNVLAVGEHALVWPDVDDLVFVKVATGVGAGVISGGSLLRGARGAAGDFGHLYVPRPPGSKRSADDDRVLGALASGTAIAELLRSRGIEASGSRDVAALVRSGNRAAVEATRRAGREVGEALVAVVHLLNPSIVVLGGSVARAGDYLLAGVREVVYRRALPTATQDLRIVPSQGGEAAAVKGAAIMVLQRVLSPQAIEQWVAAPPRRLPTRPRRSTGRQRVSTAR